MRHVNQSQNVDFIWIFKQLKKKYDIYVTFGNWTN